jgi:thiamine kinase-like enzyme
MKVAPQWEIRESLAATPVSQTWRVAVGGTLAVLRQDEAGAGRLGLNRVAEPDVIRAAAAAGLGPACRFADPGRGLLLTEWLPGRACSAADLQEPVNLSRAAALLRRVHATPLAGPVVDLGAAIDRYAAAAGSGSVDLAATAREQLARALAPVGAPLGATLPLCFCHNDPTPGNFIASPAGQLHLIDWEYGGLCHPGFDLAGLALGANLPGEQIAVLLTAYRGRPPTRAEIARHHAWEALCRSLGSLWLAALGV